MGQFAVNDVDIGELCEGIGAEVPLPAMENDLLAGLVEAAGIQEDAEMEAAVALVEFAAQLPDAEDPVYLVELQYSPSSGEAAIITGGHASVVAAAGAGYVNAGDGPDYELPWTQHLERMMEDDLPVGYSAHSPGGLAEEDNEGQVVQECVTPNRGEGDPREDSSSAQPHRLPAAGSDIDDSGDAGIKPRNRSA